MLVKISVAFIILSTLVSVFALVFLYSPSEQAAIIPPLVAWVVVGAGVWAGVYGELP